MSPPRIQLSRRILFALVVSMLVGVGITDYWTGYELRLGALYALTVGIATWHFGLVVGICIGAAAVGIEQWAELAGGKVFEQLWIPYANSASRLTIYLFVAFSFSHFRRTIDRANNQLKAFQGSLPVCACCNRVDGGDGFWMDFPTYVRKNSDVQPQFRICPVCTREGRRQSEALPGDNK